MRSWRSNILHIGLPLVAIAALSGCGSSQAPEAGTESGDQMVPVPQKETKSSPIALAAAAENFEALTEQAFTAKPDELALLFAKAQKSATGIAGQLGPEATKSLEGRLLAARTAIDARHPSDIALAAVEAFRLVVSAFSPDAGMPVAVSLLDYAGFRIQADLKSEPPRWSDAQEAAKYAHGQWDQVKDRVTDMALKEQFTASLASMDEYLSARDDEMAAKAAATELDLVDDLEGFFKLRATEPAPIVASRET
jgi:hypothetical protein